MTDNNIILPVISHMVTAVVMIFLWNRIRVQIIASIISNALILGISIYLFSKVWTQGILTTQAGDWRAPFGITFVADVFSSMMVMLTGIAGLAVSLFSSVGLRRERMKYGYYPLLHLLLMGLNGAFLTGDVFNLYVWFEIIIIASFVLMTLGGRKPQTGGGIKYVTINLFASVIFLTSIAVLYGLTGSLNMADLSLRVAGVENRGLVNVAAMLIFVAFGIKSAVFPLYFWLPASYHTPPSAIAAIFSGLLTKVGIYALLRTFTLIFIPDTFISNMIIIVAVGTLMTGALGALVKKDLRRIFSYLIVCHIGYMIAGVGMFTTAALAAAIFYLIHDIMVKTNLFLVSGIIVKIRNTVWLKQLGGMYADYPKLSMLFALVFFSLAGIPPLSGFWPKINLFQASFSTGSYALLAAIIAASFITLMVIARIWSEVFWKPAPPLENLPRDQFRLMKPHHRPLMVIPVVLLASVTLYIGLAAENILAVSQHIAGEMKDPSPYIRAVLGDSIIKR